MKFTFSLLLLLLSLKGFSQYSIKSDTIIDGRVNAELLVKECEWYRQGYKYYLPKKNIIKKIRKRSADIMFIVVFGAWCTDSRMYVPMFFKVLNRAGFSTDKVDMIAVNRNKVSELVDVTNLRATLVPTFIVLDHGKEKGRIVENMTESMEEDLLRILKKKHG